MNKIININLGGYPFTIDDDAFEHLKNYLDTIHHHFKTSDGYEEITSDIESRMAELFQEGQNNRPILSMKDVREAIAIMGTPEEFGVDEMEPQSSSSFSQKTGIKTGKRLFRDPEDKVIGGVCSGMAAYFGIQDPLWVRLLFVLLVTGGFGLPLYIILWIIVPAAETAGDRLAMRGEPINVSNIGKIIEEEIQNFGDKIDEWGNDINSKKKVKKEKKYEEAPLRKGFL